MSICCWVFRLRISLIVNVARKVWEKKICDCWHRTRRWLENWRKCQCCQVTWHSCSNHSNNLLFSLLMIEGAGTGKKIIWMGKMSNTIWFSFHTKRKIKWILLSQTLKMEHTYRLTHTHIQTARYNTWKSIPKSEQQYHLQLSFVHVCMGYSRLGTACTMTLYAAVKHLIVIWCAIKLHSVPMGKKIQFKSKKCDRNETQKKKKSKEERIICFSRLFALILECQMEWDGKCNRECEVCTNKLHFVYLYVCANSRKLNLIFAVCKHHSKKYADNITTNRAITTKSNRKKTASRKFRLQIKCANSARGNFSEWHIKLNIENE